MSSHSSYNQLCEKFADLSCNVPAFAIVKDRFKSQINSTRTYESISDFRGLLSVLKKRDCLNEDNILPLEEIAASSDDTQLKDLIRNYLRNPHDSNGNNNAQSSNKVFNKDPDGCDNLVLPDVPDTNMKRIYKLIAEDIGSGWQDFARGMEIKEGYIDQLLDKYRKIPDRVYEILTYKAKVTPTHVWRTVLCEGLRRARRNDIRRQVEELFDTM